jgi:hypothetical protein
MRSFLLLTFLFLHPLTVPAQDWVIDTDYMRFLIDLGKEPPASVVKYEEIEGSPYLTDHFVAGTLIATDSLIYRNVLLRYNIFSDEMEFLIERGGSPRVIANPRNFLYIELEEMKFKYLTFRENNRPAQGYFQVLNNGECQVLLRRKKVYAEPEKARAYGESRPPRFEEGSQALYVRFGRELPQEVRLTRRNILALFEERQDEITGFARANKLSYRRINDFVEMAGYFNQLGNR